MAKRRIMRTTACKGVEPIGDLDLAEADAFEADDRHGDQEEIEHREIADLVERANPGAARFGAAGLLSA